MAATTGLICPPPKPINLNNVRFYDVPSSNRLAKPSPPSDSDEWPDIDSVELQQNISTMPVDADAARNSHRVHTSSNPDAAGVGNHRAGSNLQAQPATGSSPDNPIIVQDDPVKGEEEEEGDESSDGDIDHLPSLEETTESSELAVAQQEAAHIPRPADPQIKLKPSMGRLDSCAPSVHSSPPRSNCSTSGKHCVENEQESPFKTYKVVAELNESAPSGTDRAPTAGSEGQKDKAGMVEVARESFITTSPQGEPEKTCHIGSAHRSSVADCSGESPGDNVADGEADRMALRTGATTHRGSVQDSECKDRLDGEDAWLVKRIVGKRERGGMSEYQVRWKETWEREENLQGCLDLVGEFEQRISKHERPGGKRRRLR